MRLSKAALTSDQNKVLSPAGVSSVLAMAFAGAAGNTQRELGLLLSGGAPEAADFHLCLKQGWDALAFRAFAEVADSELQLLHANGLWLRRGLAVKAAFLDTLSSNYDAGVQLVDFEGAPERTATAINDWAAKQTRGHISRIVSADTLLPDTSALLVQAIYLRARWARPFGVMSTYPGAFRKPDGSTVRASMMHDKVSFPYAAGDGFAAVALPYTRPGWSLWVVLPEVGRLREVRNTLSREWFRGLLPRLQERRLELALPKFNLRSDAVSLRAMLESFGVRDAFLRDSANFSAISATTPISLSDLTQSAAIRVDERGTEAAAATTAQTVASAAGPPEALTQFNADHPFLFFVVAPAGQIVFAGQVIDPTSA